MASATNLVSKTQNSHPLDDGVKTNGDFALDETSEKVYLVVNGIGALRQVAEVGKTSTSLHTASYEAGASAGAVESGFAVAGPIGSCIAGPIIMGTAIAWTIPDALKDLKAAKEELEAAEASGSRPKIEEAKHAVLMARLGLVNHYCYFSMGAGQTAAGVTGMMSKTAATKMGYAAPLGAGAATTASLAVYFALGAIYTVRGGVMMARSGMNLSYTNRFYKRLEAKHATSVDSAIKAIKDEAFERGDSCLGRGIDSSCLVKEERDGNKLTKITYGPDGVLEETFTQYTESEKIFGANDFIGSTEKDGITTTGSEDGRKISKFVPYDEVKYKKSEYLERVDKGIHTQKWRHRIGLTIGSSMLVGGILTILLLALTIATGGLAPVVIALASALFFIVMEVVFLTYDRSSYFERFRDWTYTESDFLKNALGRSETTTTEETRLVTDRTFYEQQYFLGV